MTFLRVLTALCLLACPAFAQAQTLTLLTLVPGYASGVPMGGYGTFTGTAPSTVTSATWTNCGGGAATVTNFVTPAYGSGTYFVMATPPTSAGTNCTLNITTNVGTSASSPPVVVTATNGTAESFQIHNGSGWRPSTSYVPASGPMTRVLNGAGWTPGSSTWNPGLTLNAYQLTSGSCTSAGSGGPTGTGASISDGSCTWKYLSGVDYVTLTGFLNDAPTWSSGSTYIFGGYVTTNVGGHLRSYALDSNNSSPISFTTAFCTSTVQPSGTGSGNSGVWGSPQLTVGADGCVWDYMADVIYSSQIDSIPHETWASIDGAPGGDGTFTPHITRNYLGLLWNDAEYVAGSGGENPTFQPRDHFAGHQFEENPPGGGNICATDYCANIQLIAASGESFASSYSTSTPISGYDPTKGVAIRNTSTSGTSGNNGSSALFLWDWGTAVSGLQAQSLHSSAIMGFNSQTFVYNLLDGGADPGYGTSGSTVYGDVGTIIANNLIFTRGPIGIIVKYNAAYILNNTIVRTGTSFAAPVCMASGNNTFGDIFLNNNVCMGFSTGHALGIQNGSSFTISPGSGNNITDAPIGDSGLTWWEFNGGSSTGSTVQTMPGTYGSTQTAAFINPGTDYRPSTALVGAGAALGNFNYCNAGVPTPCTHNYDTPDAIGTTRPMGGLFDAGALEHGGTFSPAFLRLKWGFGR